MDIAIEASISMVATKTSSEGRSLKLDDVDFCQLMDKQCTEEVLYPNSFTRADGR